jgi:hypothetical protein
MKNSEARAVIYLSYLSRPEADQKELSRLGRELLYGLLSHAGENADGLEIKKGVNGRPYFDNCERLDFSISHSNELVVCALSVEEGRVGVDTERTESTIRKEKQPLFAGRFFSGNEREILEKAEKGLYAVKCPGYFIDMGVPEAYFRANTEIPLLFGKNTFKAVFLDRDGVIEVGENYVFYTYNHYNDFQEYLNYEGGWGEMFGNITGGGTLSSKYDYNPTPYVEVTHRSFVYADGTPVATVSEVIVLWLPKREEV